jgi:DNA-binding transcriptional regulator/RsmH inhibitor MraZ
MVAQPHGSFPCVAVCSLTVTPRRTGRKREKMFEGIYHVDFDDHRRVALPESWQHSAICQEVVMMAAKRIIYRDCLRAFAPVDFGTMANNLRLKRSESSLDSRTLRLIAICSDTCEVDSKWRLRLGALPQFSRMFDSTVSLIGHGQFFEVRRPEQYWEGLTSFDENTA